MSDVIRWCFTCKGYERPYIMDVYRGCTNRSHDVADAVVVRADQSLYRYVDCPCMGRDHHPTWRNGVDRSDGYLPDCQETVLSPVGGDNAFHRWK